MSFTEESATDAVLASLAGTPDPRVRSVVEAMVRHLHAFVREVEPTMVEWGQGIAFLTAVGHRSDDTRQEFVLLSDVLGVSMLVEAVNARLAGGPTPGDVPAVDAGLAGGVGPTPGDATGAADATGVTAPTAFTDAVTAVTASTVLGPFHVVASPPRQLGADIDVVGGHQACVVTGRVTDPDGDAVSGATVDVWQCDEAGFYDVQRPDVQPLGNGRGLFTADSDGRFWFRTVVPSFYPIPTDGPVGDLLRATARHPYRPAHIHLIVAAAGFVPLTTHLFVADSPYIDSDAVFAVNESLVCRFAEIDDPGLAARWGVDAPFRLADANLVVRPDRR